MIPPSRLKWLHLTVGVLVLLAFLGTGQFMDRRLDHLVGMADAPRALYRSSHIYILFSALLNLVLGATSSARRSSPVGCSSTWAPRSCWPRPGSSSTGFSSRRRWR